jgi:hypothetical protein
MSPDTNRSSDRPTLDAASMEYLTARLRQVRGLSKPQRVSLQTQAVAIVLREEPGASLPGAVERAVVRFAMQQLVDIPNLPAKAFSLLAGIITCDEDREDILSQSLVGTARGVRARFREGRLDLTTSIEPLFWCVLRSRKNDWLRGRSRLPIPTSDEVLAVIASELHDGGTGDRWKVLGPLKKQEVMAIIRRAIDALPPGQKRTMGIYVNRFPLTKDMRVLRQEVSKMVGCDHTLSAVKRSLEEGRRKVRRALRSKGYEYF